jgi:hypothetical protein
VEKAPLIIIGTILFLGVVAFLGFWFFYHPVGDTKVTPLPSGIVFFYGNGCPHCADLETYISDNKIASKVKYTMEEVWYNEENANLLQQVAEQTCGLKESDIGVPFIYDGNGKCYVGVPDAETFFATQAGITPPASTATGATASPAQ